MPHPTLRQKASEVPGVDKKLLKFITNLESTLAETKNPKGVGLAGPQVDKLWRIFTIKVDKPLTLINPVISKHSKKATFDENQAGEPFLEGCLSIPKIWGPVPRWQWVEVEFEKPDALSKKLVKHGQKFVGFEARVVQHEYDHLEGILFTDYALKLDLPVFQGNRDGDRLKKIDRELVELF